jgi:hypothetical protein
MDKPAQASAMLQKVVAECPDTPAAAKALERLAALGIEPDAAAGHAGGSDPGDDGSTSPGMPRGFKRK